jgi:hypothetical protein
VEISQALDISLSEIQAQYFRDSDTSSEVEQVLVEEQDLLWENLQERERFDDNIWRECEEEFRSYCKDSTF